MRLGQPFYLCDSAVYKLMYELMVKQFGRTLSGKEKKEGVRAILTLSDPTSDLVQHYDFPVPLQCRKMSDMIFVVFVCQQSGPV
jgi:hypothetical protein